MPARQIVHVRPREGSWEIGAADCTGKALFPDRASALEAAKTWAAENAPCRAIFHTETGEGEVFDFEAHGESTSSRE